MRLTLQKVKLNLTVLFSYGALAAVLLMSEKTWTMVSNEFYTSSPPLPHHTLNAVLYSAWKIRVLSLSHGKYRTMRCFNVMSNNDNGSRTIRTLPC